jgi:hypothetical protein
LSKYASHKPAIHESNHQFISKNSNKLNKKRKDKQRFISTINITHISQKHQWTSQKKYPTTIGYWSLKRKKDKCTFLPQSKE